MFIGIDLGSRFVKIAYSTIKDRVRVDRYSTIDFYKKYCIRRKKTLVLDLKKINPLFARAKRIVSTGYGKHIGTIQNIERITEIEAHVFGACRLTGLHTFTLLDIGGQDTKVISVKKGKIVDFMMNEKCAAGSGRYLENMANILDVPLNKIGDCHKKPVLLSNTCAIFGESEVVGHIVEGKTVEQIASGVNYSVFFRVKNDIKNFGNKTVVFVGGLAHNKAIQKHITKMAKKVIMPKNAEFNGAIGCLYNCHY